jgi:hypothetical protein
MPRSDDHSTGDGRQPYAEQGGPEGRHAQTHDVRREEATRSKPQDQGPDEFADDLASDRSRAAEVGDSIPASEDKQLQTEMPGLDADDLNRLSILKSGTKLDQGSVYVDLNDLERGPFKAMGDQEASGDTRYVAKRDTDYEMWGRLVGQGRPALVERPGDHG